MKIFLCLKSLVRFPAMVRVLILCKRIISPLVVVFIISFLFVSCTRTVNVGVDAWPPCEIWYVSRYLQLPKQENVKLKIVRYPTWRSAVESFYEGNLDIVHSSYFNTIYYCNKGVEGRIGIVADRSLGLDGMVVSPSIGKIEELKGRAIGVEIGTDEYFLLYKILKNHSLAFNEVKIVSIASWEAPEYLRTGKLDAVVTYEPYLSRAATYGRISETTMQYPDIIMDVIVFSRSIASDRGMRKKIRSMWFETIRWIFKSPSNLSKACEIMASEERISVREFKKFFGKFHFFSESDNNIMLVKGGRVESVLRSIDTFLTKEKIIHKNCDIGGLILR